MNFMQIIEKSSRTHDKGSYDQAEEVYASISRRRKSRFMQQGKLPGILCLVSSKRYPGQFTDRKQAEAVTDPTIYVYDKTTWDVKPAGTFTGARFRVFVGDESRKPYVLTEEHAGKEYASGETLEVPEEYRQEFERDIMGALRDIAGVSTIARFPFIQEPDSIRRSQGKVPNVFSLESTDFVSDVVKLLPKRLFKPEIERYAHIDLGITGDSAGLTIGCCPGFTKVDRGAGQFETLPLFWLDGVLEIRPPKGGEIIFDKIRNILYVLRDQCKLNIRYVSFDSFQSRDSMQLLRQRGFQVGLVSMDTDMLAYDVTKRAYAENRVSMPVHAKALREFAGLEKDTKKGKIDHPPKGSKDVSDSIAGVIYGLTMQRSTWLNHGVPTKEIPESLRMALMARKEAKTQAAMRDVEVERTQWRRSGPIESTNSGA